MKYRVPDIDNLMPGQFGLRKSRYNAKDFKEETYFVWYTCRESFQNDWTRSEYNNFEKIFFYVGEKDNIKSFIEQAEKKLGLYFTTKFYSTTDPNVCVICPARFWRNNSLRLSLFTILLRASLAYINVEQNWLDVLFENNYAKSTKGAILYFLDGNTVPIRKADNFVDGWRNQFAYYEGPLNKALRRPRLSSLGFWFKEIFHSCKRKILGW